MLLEYWDMLLVVKDRFQGVGLMDFYRNDTHITRDSQFLNTIDIKKEKTVLWLEIGYQSILLGI